MSADGRSPELVRLVADDGAAGSPADAMWRRRGVALVEPPPVEPPPVDPPRARRPDTSAEPSPWSREAANAPTPTIAQIRERWRRELDVDGDRIEDPAPLLPAAPRRAMSVPHQPPSSTTGDVVLNAIWTMSVVSLALLAGWLLVPPAAPTITDVLPANADPRWRVQIEVGTSAAMLDADANAVAYVGAGDLTVIDASTGDGRWRQPLALSGPSEVRIYGDTVVAASRVVPNESIAGYDLASGTLLWSRTRDDTEFELRDDGLLEFVDTGATVAVRVLDPATGLAVGPAATASDVDAPSGYVVGRSGNDLVLIDTVTGQAASSNVPDLDLKGLAAVGDATVGFTTDNGIVLFDRRGQVIDQRQFVSSVRGDFTGRAELVGGVSDASLGIVASGSSIGFDVAAGDIDVTWELVGRVGEPVRTSAGPIAATRTVHPLTAEIDVELVDVRTGESIAVTDLGLTREADPVVVHDGYVVWPPLADPDRVVTAFGFDGDERWSLSTPLGSWFEVLDGVLYVVDPSEGTLTAHG